MIDAAATFDAAATLDALARGTVASLGRRDVVIVEGPEAATYLHGQASQNITGLAVGDSARTFVLAPQGRIDAWARVTRVADETFWLDVETGYGQQLLERLERFKLRTKATFALIEMSMLQVRGPQSPQTQLMGVDGADVEPTWIDTNGVETLGFDRLMASGDPEIPSGVPVGDPAAFEAARIRSGIPRMGSEIGEKTIPAELGVVESSADFTKGCYVGQELVARVDSRGNNTPRKVWFVEIAGVVPEVGTSVDVDNSPVGVITSVASDGAGGAVALASIKRSAPMPGPAEVAGASATVRPLSA